MTTQVEAPSVPRRATIYPFTWGKVVNEHEIGPYQIVEYHPYKSGGVPIDERGRRLPREVETHTLFHVYYDGQDSNQSTNTLEGAMLVAIYARVAGRRAGNDLPGAEDPRGRLLRAQ